MPLDAATQALLSRKAGKRESGRVSLRDFDRGVVETLGAVIDEAKSLYILKIPSVETEQDFSGVVVTFANPEPVFTPGIVPRIFVRREDIAPALNRWHPGLEQFRAPGEGALPITIGTRTGFASNRSVQQASPFDITYSVNIQARHRGADQKAGLRNQTNRLLAHTLSVFQPYGALFVTDDIGDVRSYECFVESITDLDEVADITDRVVGFSVTLRVEGELDLNQPVTKKAVAGDPAITLTNT